MITPSDLSEMPAPALPKTMPGSAAIQFGPPIEPLTRVLVYDSAEWEKFIDEWVSSSLKSNYKQVLRFTGANDHGVDIAGFADDKRFLGVWDNYQCKHYAQPLSPSTAWLEIGKILWYSFTKVFNPPRAYYFVAPRGAGTTLTQYLSNVATLKTELKKAWKNAVESKITSTQVVALSGDFARHVEAFDFSIFKTISTREIVEQHKTTPYFAARFGGGLPPRPQPEAPPDEIQNGESVYVAQLLAAYGDHAKERIADVAALKQWKELEDHFKRHRECFYHAESLRVFVRDKVEPGTFESLQDEIFHGVADAAGATHADGYARVNAVTDTAQKLPLDAHALGASAFVRDKRGICHQLANKGRLQWTKP